MASVNRPTLAGLQAELAALRHNCDLVETERDALRVKCEGLGKSIAALREECDTMRAERDALLTQQRPSRDEKPVVAQISERRAAMQRAREEAMATGRYVKV